MNNDERLWIVALIGFFMVVVSLVGGITIYNIRVATLFAEGGYVSCPGSQYGWCKP